MNKLTRSALLFVAISGSLRADVKLPAIFGDHMVLQQEASIPVWGTADTGEKVTVTLGAESASATADPEGKWMVKLPALPNGSPATTLTVAGKNSLTFSDVLVGDVWLCSGQSNMEFALSAAHNKDQVIPAANDPQLRLFVVKHAWTLQPAPDVDRAPMPNPPATPPAPGSPPAPPNPPVAFYGTWMLCTPDTVKNFTAVGYFFGRELRTSLNRPIGLIESNFGGTPAEAWTSLQALEKVPELKAYADTYNTLLAAYPAAVAALPARTAAYSVALHKWNDAYGKAYQATLKDWNDAVAKAKAANQDPPPRPMPPVPQPPPPPPPGGNNHTPTELFNGMIAPLIPYAIKGTIWYQGESNTAHALEYRTLFPTMINDWRARWAQGDFPFLFVQIARYDDSKYPNQDWAVLRESQVKTLSLPNTAMASAVDIGNPTNIHPVDKLDVGLRLALTAKHVAYGQSVVYEGPLYDSIKVEGNSIRVSFTQTGGGLVVGSAPWMPDGLKEAPISKTELEDFTIAGDDKKFVPAQAKIDGNTVVVSSPQVPNPIAVRYGWEDVPRINLYNKEGLPASPFRSDDWEIIEPPPPGQALPPPPTTPTK